MAVIALAADKGSPGVTTAAIALGAVWPRPVLVAECDQAGGDLVYRLPAMDGGMLDPARGLLSLAASARRGLLPAQVWEHTQRLVGGLDVLVGLTSAEQAQGLTWLWEPLGRAFSRLPSADQQTGADVLVDCGRLGANSPLNPVLHQADIVVVFTRPNLEQVAHLRERVNALAGELGGGKRSPLCVAVIADPREFRRSVSEVSRIVVNAELPAAVLGGVALDPKGAEMLRGEWGGRLDRSLLIRSAREIAGDLINRLAQLSGPSSHSPAPGASVHEQQTAPATPQADTGQFSTVPPQAPQAAAPAGPPPPPYHDHSGSHPQPMPPAGHPPAGHAPAGHAPAGHAPVQHHPAGHPAGHAPVQHSPAHYPPAGHPPAGHAPVEHPPTQYPPAGHPPEGHPPPAPPGPPPADASMTPPPGTLRTPPPGPTSGPPPGPPAGPPPAPPAGPPPGYAPHPQQGPPTAPPQGTTQGPPSGPEAHAGHEAHEGHESVASPETAGDTAPPAEAMGAPPPFPVHPPHYAQPAYGPMPAYAPPAAPMAPPPPAGMPLGRPVTAPMPAPMPAPMAMPMAMPMPAPVPAAVPPSAPAPPSAPVPPPVPPPVAPSAGSGAGAPPYAAPGHQQSPEVSVDSAPPAAATAPETSTPGSTGPGDGAAFQPGVRQGGR